MKYAILMPVFNDWHAIRMLIEQIDVNLSGLIGQSESVDVYIVNDGSTTPVAMEIACYAPQNLSRLLLITLRRNLGHQWAIAIGLSLLNQESHDAVIVMDADGEDNPGDMPRLLQRLQQESYSKVVFAARAKRSESLLFQCFYRLYQMLHFILTGRSVRVGNFSVIPRSRLMNIIVTPEICTHYAAAVIATSVPWCAVPCDRAERLHGKSTMNLVSLIRHGLAALSVFGETVGVHVLLLSTSLCLILGIALVFMPSAGRAASLIPLLMAPAVASAVLSFLYTLLMCSIRSRAAFIPFRDYEMFVDQVAEIGRAKQDRESSNT